MLCQDIFKKTKPRVVVRRIERKRIYGDNLEYEAFLDRLGVLLLETNNIKIGRIYFGVKVHGVRNVGNG